ncbi:transcriptional regulator, GntR family with aminotransferase domain [Pseudogulbenkiania sp. NH8B]|uniref:MocR-like pyridoxine biosynthesis transcription factor PdxR n=1 Tax=Pseudogulbenkiania sp. (strain NH8B) TaxID=748280 RepID=UPI0002279385|nr:PLP-dependent aminotransferase family protein [Pseudogulbenkiania sp. NH8B]BAK75279.1 transcriptional regulator, GntR family with aminotransferase domain [Pseudogulbenkiania sp. NH8B]
MSSDWIVDALQQVLQREGSAALHRQLYHQLRDWIRQGRLSGGSTLPASRQLARELQLGRNTVLAAYDQLQAEGYLESRHGSGTYVSDVFTGRDSPSPAAEARLPGLSQRGEQLSRHSNLPQGVLGAFAPGVPALDAFPQQQWQRLLSRHNKQPCLDWLGYCHDGGLPALREVLCDYLRQSRSVLCRPEQIVITQGAQQALELCARLLADPGDTVWLEEPGYAGAQAAMTAAGLDIVPVPVDAEGLNPALAPPARAPRLIYVTPSHQYPSGVVMTLGRRLELLKLAEAHRSWIVEDDYDSEFRYHSQPLASLQGLANGGAVIYLGTFSKVMYPGLRLGYLVLPEALIDPFRASYARLYREGHYAIQAALADFIAEGHFARHIRRMRELYQIRQTLLRETLHQSLGEQLPLSPGEAGMHLVASLPGTVNEQQLSAVAAREGLWLRPLARHFWGPATRRGLVLGYAGVPEAELCRAARRMAELFEQEMQHQGR